MSLKGYYEFIMQIPDESREAVANKLTEMGSTGFFEKNDAIAAYFEGSANIAFICKELEQFREVLASSGLNPDFSYDYILLPEQDWNEEWKKSFTPIDAGDNITIVPSWLKHDTDRMTIIIDPGMAFGTGHHETTKRCLLVIEGLSARREGSVLDVGTGTGILAIGASRLGFGPVTGVDIDPLAVELAQRNVKTNSLKNVTIQEGTISNVSGSFNIITANLISELLIEIAHEIVSRLNPGGTAVLSGMITGQENGVIHAMEKSGLILEETLVDGKWVTLVFSSKQS